jgi:glycosidase
MIAVRKKYHAFGRGDFAWVDAGTNAVAAYQRRYKNETLLALHNLLDSPVNVEIARKGLDVLTGENIARGAVSLAPFQYRWLLQEFQE